MTKEELKKARVALDQADEHLETAYQELREAITWLGLEQLKGLEQEAEKVLNDLEFVQDLSQCLKATWKKQEGETGE